ncbi:MAG TPA: heme ABC transporter ATP-binding protein CcmA [Oceanospirillaceae bacterium]|nr:heme ABC transporter ATP-binding protein CcmA [Oceanospirillaceae bacterium]
MTTPPILLQVAQLACERDERCLFSGLQFSVRAGEIWHIKGPNGSGKTSLLRQLAGLLPVDKGDISFPTEKSLLYIGHKLALKEQLTANENLAWLSALSTPSTEQQRYSALAKVGLRGFEETLVAHLSAGQKRRVALARLHLQTAPLWLLDEPLTAMDQEGIKDQQGWFSEHLEKGGAMVFTSHQDLTLDGVKVIDLSTLEEARV